MTDKGSGLANNAGFGSKNPTEPSSLDVELEPMPSRTPETDSDHPSTPPARSGKASEEEEKPTDGDPDVNLTHHTGHIPPPVTVNRD